MFPHSWWKGVWSKAVTFFMASWLVIKNDLSIWSRNKMTGHKLASHNIAEEEEPKTKPSAHRTMGTFFWFGERCIWVYLLLHGETIFYPQTLRKLHPMLDIQGRELFCNTPLYLHTACNSEELQRAFPIHFTIQIYLPEFIVCLVLWRVRCEDSAMPPSRQSRKLSVIVNELLKWSCTTRASSHF